MNDEEYEEHVLDDIVEGGGPTESRIQDSLSKGLGIQRKKEAAERKRLRDAYRDPPDTKKED